MGHPQHSSGKLRTESIGELPLQRRGAPMPSNDQSYFAARAEQERRLARQAADAKVAALHSQLA